MSRLCITLVWSLLSLTISATIVLLQKTLSSRYHRIVSEASQRRLQPPHSRSTLCFEYVDTHQNAAAIWHGSWNTGRTCGRYAAATPCQMEELQRKWCIGVCQLSSGDRVGLAGTTVRLFQVIRMATARACLPRTIWSQGHGTSAIGLPAQRL